MERGSTLTVVLFRLGVDVGTDVDCRGCGCANRSTGEVPLSRLPPLEDVDEEEDPSNVD